MADMCEYLELQMSVQLPGVSCAGFFYGSLVDNGGDVMQYAYTFPFFLWGGHY